MATFGREVNVGDEGCGVSIRDEALLDLSARLGLHHTLHGDADHLGAGIGALLDLCVCGSVGSRGESFGNLFATRWVKTGWDG
jgi:hypothetical protein